MSSAYFSMSLPSVIARRSAALMTYKASPSADPCITLTKISMMSESSPLNLVQSAVGAVVEKKSSIQLKTSSGSGKVDSL